ncbi:rab-GTPase-TBC domain-domain-containing protein [Syncephalastrum racemosum]|uniref:Rab-GTPase-TBC domain-domain-containing protein n=1 Tax=Syncephalastrum racemosum TaxID=13706 RepID=A0A1X2HNB2_SYNRA|nr:rab-GTPase-TBC domain-domain-containing protein [Syncephalastrum racemosum]
MFKQENGEGQRAMRRILEAYSLYDSHVGYCQGLAFLVGPLLMHMEEQQAFCVFVRLMETYQMRTLFTMDMEGLQLRLYQFAIFLNEQLPELAKHMESHGIHPAMYASQWFLTLFAYNFSMERVERIYDIVFVEGAAETTMRFALALLRHSESKILAETEFEDLLDHVTLGLDRPTDDIVREAADLASVVTRSKMEALEERYAREGQAEKRERAEQVLTTSRRFFFWRRRRTTVSSRTSTSTSTQQRPSCQMERDDMDYKTRFMKLQLKHQQTLDELAELRMDKCDVENERDALKMTIRELERSNKRRPLTRSRTLFEYSSDDRPPENDMESIESSTTSFSEATYNSSGCLTIATEQQDDTQFLRTELVRIKVDHFELQQHCEKLTQELEDAQSRHDMVTEGQMVLIDKLMSTQSQMDELIKEKKAKDMAWLQLVRENQELKAELSLHLPSLDSGTVSNTNNSKSSKEIATPAGTPLPRRKSMGDIRPQRDDNVWAMRELERALAEAKVRLAELETMRANHPAHDDDCEGKRRFTTECCSAPYIDVRPMSRSSSLYGRVWHALAPNRNASRQIP